MGVWLAIVLEVAVIVGMGFFCFSLLASLGRSAPFVPTGRREIAWILREVAEVQPQEIFYDLGSGDGRVVRAAARLGARATGLEQSSALVWWSRLLARGCGIFVMGNYLKEDLRGADVIFCYLMPGAMEKLKEKFERELKPGARVISRAFKIPGWTPTQRFQFRPKSPPVYIYRIVNHEL